MKRRGRTLEAGLAAVCAILLAAPAAPLPPTRREPPASETRGRLEEGEVVGRLQIPRLGLDVPIFEGVSDATLHKGPGHIPETTWPAPGPNGRGNCVITGHRDASFLPLRRARAGDLVRVTDTRGLARTFHLTYRRIVLPEAYSVTNQTRRARLTLITCYPFRWKGSAPYRLVWTATPAAADRFNERPKRGA